MEPLAPDRRRDPVDLGGHQQRPLGVELHLGDVPGGQVGRETGIGNGNFVRPRDSERPAEEPEHQEADDAADEQVEAGDDEHTDVVGPEGQDQRADDQPDDVRGCQQPVDPHRLGSVANHDQHDGADADGDQDQAEDRRDGERIGGGTAVRDADEHASDHGEPPRAVGRGKGCCERLKGHSVHQYRRTDTMGNTIAKNSQKVKLFGDDSLGLECIELGVQATLLLGQITMYATFNNFALLHH